MAEESEKRFHAVMDKLFLAPPPNSKSTTTTASTSATAGGLSRERKRPHTMTTTLAVVDSKFKGGTIKELQNASGGTVQSPMCRPWDREDLLKRLATFKSMTWFAKPEVVSAINCARRGWVNVDMDIIACESCRARLFFSTPSSWAQQQVEKAASVFSLKLNNGHKLLCPWVDNACDEKLAQFPPTSPADLVDSYKKRCASVLQLLELPVISSTAIDHMSSPLLEHFLKSPPALEYVNGHDNVSARGFGDEREEVLPVLYYQAQKLISLCGWEPRLLPYIVDCKDVQDQSIKGGTLPDPSEASNAQNASLTVYTSRTAENVETNQSPATGSEQYDHTSVVLDCRLCGARVGLWAFRTTPRPAEFVRLIGHAELNEENEAACQMDDANHPNVETSHAAKGEQTASIAKIGTTSSSRNLLNLTIAGGPPPAEQNFRPTISLPVVGQNLRRRFSSAFESVDGDQQPFKALSQVGKEHMRLVQKTNEDAHHSATSNGSVDGVDNGGHMSVGGDVIMKTATSGTNKPYTATTDQLENVDGKSSNSGDNTPEDLANVETLNTVTGDLHSPEDEGSSKTLGIEDSALDHAASLNNVLDTSLAVNDNVQQSPVIDKNCNKQVNNRDCGEQTPGLPLKSSSAYLEDSKQPSAAKAMELDPIKQHRHFCPWIASSGKSAPGWKQTLSALERQKEFIYPSATTQASSSLIEVEDPVGSVKKLLTPPSAKRKKFTYGSS
ncbi:uncharacterized protein LOC112508744 isoform X2 [Cynara cardunculus var. scolymus]|uniref:Zinc finger, C3HC-like protein n=1 Tax=Cynara cardunculus var. scolymus TaxID=59895 RepID=A0A103YCB3_CYNCS|nr:uncharacterized protein LOC112508744 isoform X2 [Cynara cardunculus var. scolymus]KVI06472.1 Zinc finger, C3HC-like protein [Cynara cardunculus var. scolymus]